MENQSFKTLNPWLALWFQPRKVAGHLLETRTPRQGFWLLIITCALMTTIVLSILATLFRNALTPELGSIAILSGIYFSLAFVMGVYFKLVLLFAAGRLLGGKASWSQAATLIPHVVSICLVYMVLFMAIYSIIMNNLSFIFGDVSAVEALKIRTVVLSLVVLVMYFYGMICISHCIGQLQRFSAWKGFLCLISPSLAFMALKILV